MLRPTLYIPSQLAKLLIPITLQQMELLMAFGWCRGLR